MISLGLKYLNLFQAIFNAINLTKQANGSYWNFTQILARLDKLKITESLSYN